jgi:hypothetical protein
MEIAALLSFAVLVLSWMAMPDSSAPANESIRVARPVAAKA